MSLTLRKPHGLLRFILRMPIWLYRAKLGWLMGNRFLMLTHLGRKSGQSRQVVLEVVSHDETTGAYFVAAGWRGKADWFQNVQQNPEVRFTVRTQTFLANAKIIEPTNATEIFLDYAQRYPLAFQELSRMMIGEALRSNAEDCLRLAESVPLVKLTPIQSLEKETL